MPWLIRHQGAAQSKALSQAQIIQGLRDGILGPLDEVQGTRETTWQALENHPQFAELVEQLETPPPKKHEEPTNLDMNALIDVCLVLLIFFILTTSYASTVQKVVPLPESKKETKKVKTVKLQDVKNKMIRMQASLNAQGKTILLVENQGVEVLDGAGGVDPDKLSSALKPFVTVGERRTEMLLDAQGVSWATFIAIQDGAKGAGIHTIHLLRK